MSGFVFQSPVNVRTPLSSGFATARTPPRGGGTPRRHEGIDLGGRAGDPVFAAGDGIVAAVQSGRIPPRTAAEQGEVCASSTLRAGNYVEIDHEDGLRTRYLHLDRVQVRKGQLISAGTRIGTLGRTGCITGPHLHFEVLEAGEPVNPLLLTDVRGEGWSPNRVAAGSGGWVYRQWEDGRIEVVETPDGRGVGRIFSPQSAADAGAIAAITREIGPFEEDGPDYTEPVRAVAMELQDDVRDVASTTTAMLSEDPLASLELTRTTPSRPPGDLLLALAPRTIQPSTVAEVALGGAGVLSLALLVQAAQQRRAPNAYRSSPA